ncbi:MAG: IS630 family transposase [Rhodoplanes sp.]
MWEPAKKLALAAEDRRLLETWTRAHNAPQNVAMRCQVILLAADGLANNAIAQALGISRPTVLLWRERFAGEGPKALVEVAPGRGRRRTITAAKVKRIVTATTQTTPASATHWSCRTMARAQGVSAATVQRIWDAHGLQPHRVKTFKLSRDKRFVEKLTDVVGVYLNPPDKAVILCVDEKSQIQALDRTQPGLPLKKGRCGTMTHDYKRNGTTTLFAALNTLEGTVIGTCYPRHRNIEFRKFLRQIDQSIPAELDIHMILDNYGTHKHPQVQSWLARHQRFHLHFTPTSSSWLNLVERWFRNLSDKRIRRGSFSSVPELILAIQEFIAANNDAPKPFVWTASVEKILAKISHCKAILETLH